MTSVFKKIASPPGYVVASTLISIGGFLNGYDTGSIGSVTEMKFFQDTFGELTPIMRGFTVSLIMLTGAFPSFFAGQLANRYGHLSIIMAGALVFTLGAALQGGAYHLPMFLSGRALSGFGEGLWISNCYVYVTEISPSARRGVLVSISQLATTTGLCGGYFTCYGSTKIVSSISWRLPYIIQAAFAFTLAVSTWFLPTSPRWLMLSGKRVAALKEIDRLNLSRVEAEKDFLNSTNEIHAAPSTLEGFLIIFRRQYRARTMLALFILGMVQLSGIDGVLFYAPTLFAQAGLPSQSASFLASGVSAILIFAVSIPAFLVADRVGRRTSILVGGSGLAFCMIVIGSLYASKSVHPTGAVRWVVVVLIFAFALTYAFTWAVSAKIYASEIQPARTRAAANCVAQGVNFFTNWLVAFTTPIFLANSSFGAYFLFGFLTLGTVLVLTAYMPETRGRSLEDIQAAFHHRPLARSWMYHLRKFFSRSGVSPAGSEGAQSNRNSLELNVMRGGNGSTPIDVGGLLAVDGGTGTGIEMAADTAAAEGITEVRAVGG
ncbi:general substrate transporter [Mytilinidion resinicola]|uniref:General substrate transporter n=1 Tax=Mytilinidion resinicola TaxID=574789 RepID=A0A6A6Z509_9PEZI|nr:general substrate transporter [Mytilinidion resinicola]KAF2816110.1 general substrate transporter [Mytilinidion resinicola]